MMPANVSLLLIDLALAALALVLVRRERRTPAPRASRASSSKPERGDLIATLVRTGRVGDPALADPVRSSVRVAPADAAATALEVFAADGSELTRIGTDQVVMVRAWSGGRQVVSIGKPRPAYGPFWPLGPNLAGWEIHLVSASGDTLRCYGTPGTSLDEELERLQSRIRRFPLARAS